MLYYSLTKYSSTYDSDLFIFYFYLPSLKYVNINFSVAILLDHIWLIRDRSHFYENWDEKRFIFVSIQYSFLFIFKKNDQCCEKQTSLPQTQISSNYLTFTKIFYVHIQSRTHDEKIVFNDIIIFWYNNGNY